MHIWQLQEAKAKLSSLIKEAQIEPQIISRHGICEIIVMSLSKYEDITNTKGTDFVSFFRESPLYGIDLDVERDKTEMRDIEL